MAHNYRKLAEQVYDIFTRGAVDELPTVFAPGFIEHEEIPGSTATGVAAVAEWVTASTAGISGISYRVDSVVGQGSELVCRVHLTGKHTGTMFGAPATGNDVDVLIMDWIRLTDDGLIAEHWGTSQELQLLTQLGLMPAEAATIDLTAAATART